MRSKISKQEELEIISYYLSPETLSATASHFCRKNLTIKTDFDVNGQLYEIKGSQFLKEDGTWQNLYNHDLDGLFEAKHQCAVINNVKILYPTDYKFYTDWFISNGYNKDDYIKQD